MDKVPETELLSAYLDGELTAAEQARAEELLAANPAARQWVEEMRALSHTLQSLPQEKVGEDLGPRVLRLAEQRMLTDAPPAEPAKPVFHRRSRCRRSPAGRCAKPSAACSAAGRWSGRAWRWPSP